MEVAPEARESEQGSSISVPTGQDMPPKTDQGKEEGASSPTKEVETLPPKEEETVVEGEPVRRRRIQFGSAHLHLLKAVAEADQANWTSLQEAITRAPQPAKVKSEFVERLTQLADLRVKSQEAAEEKAVEHARRAKHYTEAETQYRAGLNNQILRLEMMNPVGPRTGVPIISDRRRRAAPSGWPEENTEPEKGLPGTDKNRPKKRRELEERKLVRSKTSIPPKEEKQSTRS